MEQLAEAAKVIVLFKVAVGPTFGGKFIENSSSYYKTAGKSNFFFLCTWRRRMAPRGAVNHSPRYRKGLVGFNRKPIGRLATYFGKEGCNGSKNWSRPSMRYAVYPNTQGNGM